MFLGKFETNLKPSQKSYQILDKAKNGPHARRHAWYPSHWGQTLYKLALLLDFSQDLSKVWFKFQNEFSLETNISKSTSCKIVADNLQKTQMPIFGWGFQRIWYKVACLMGPEIPRSPNQNKSYFSQSSWHWALTQNYSAQLLTVTFKKDGNGAECARPQQQRSALTFTFKVHNDAE